MPTNYLTGYAPNNVLSYGGLETAPYSSNVLAQSQSYQPYTSSDPNYFDEAAARGTASPYAPVDQGHLQSLYDSWHAANPTVGMYHAGDGGSGFGGAFKKVGKAAKFELNRAGHLIKSVANDPSRLFTGVDPLSTGIWNRALGTHNQALVGQLGGATENDFQRYAASHGGEQSLGAGRALSHSADAIAGIFGAAGAAHGLGQAAGSFGSGASNAGNVGNGASSGGDLGIFSNGGTGGLGGVGGGNAGVLAQSGAIGGGAGIGGTTGGALGGFSGIANGISGAGGSGAGGSMGWGDWVNLAGSVYGAYAQGQGAKDAANASAAGSAAGIAEQRRQFDLSRGDQMPWLQSGTAALGRLNDPNAFTQSPGYQFTRDEAFRDIGNQFSAKGGAQSGNALRALQDRGAQLGSLEYNNWFNQQSNLAGLGQSSAQSLGAIGQNSANNVSNLLGQQGNARASGIEGQTNALTGGISDFLSWYNRRNQGGGGSGGGGGGTYNPTYGGGWN